MLKRDNENEDSGLAKRLFDLQAETRNILLLHFKQGMSYASVAYIFSRDIADVERICSNFAASFSQKEYMMNVVNWMAKQNQNSKLPSRPCVKPDTRDEEIAELRKKLTEAQIKAELYQEMVRLAEVTYQIPIRKKFGAK